MRVGRIILVALAATLLLGACSSEEGAELELALTSDSEVCEDPDACGGDGSGSASVTINSDEEEVCYDVTLEGMENVTAAHIHEAPEGEAGDIVVDLVYEGDDSGGDACVESEESLLEEISENPGDYYFNVHSEAYPDGAARAQLDS